MHFEGEELVEAAKIEVWEALNDPKILKDCIPGCTSIEKVSDSEFHLSMAAVVGPVKAKFKGKLKLENLSPPDSYTLTFSGSGGVAGFGKGEARVNLISANERTILKYAADASVGGKLAQVGARLIDGVAKKMAHDFFSTFKKHFTPEAKGDINQVKLNSKDEKNKTSIFYWAVLIALITMGLSVMINS